MQNLKRDGWEQVRAVRFIPLLAAFVLLLAWPQASRAQVVHSNALAWGASTTPGALYNVYKDHLCTGTFAKLTATPIATLNFTDTGMADGECNAYYITAIGAPGSNIGESTQAESTVIKIVTPTVISTGFPLAAPPTAPSFKSQ